MATFLKRISLFIQAGFLCSPICVLGQTSFETPGRDEYILETRAYKKGVYRTFEEFKFNRPSIVDHYVIGKKSIWITDPATGRNKKLKSYETWGFNDGSRVFVKRNKFNELVEKGRYCYFKERGTRLIYMVAAVPFLVVPIPTPYEDELIINFNTGKRYRLTKKLMREILEADDTGLLEMFQQEQNKSKKFYDYIVKYNDRNSAKIK